MEKMKIKKCKIKKPIVVVESKNIKEQFLLLRFAFSEYILFFIFSLSSLYLFVALIHASLSRKKNPLKYNFKYFKNGYLGGGRELSL